MITQLTALLILMILGAFIALESRELLSGIIAMGIMGFALTLAFLMLKAPDLALVQIIVETLTLILFIAAVHLTGRGKALPNERQYLAVKRVAGIVFIAFIGLVFYRITSNLPAFGEGAIRMAGPILAQGAAVTGSDNLVTAVVLDFRALDTLGEATVLFTAAMGVLVVLRHEGRQR